jgi:hypothetical protein
MDVPDVGDARHSRCECPFEAGHRIRQDNVDFVAID